MTEQMNNISPEDALRELAYMYQTQGADPIREILKQNNFPDELIEQLIQMLEITSQEEYDEYDDEDDEDDYYDEDDEDQVEGVATLHPEVINALCQNTFAVMTGAPDHHTEWLDEVATLRLDVASRGVDWIAELEFIDALTAILQTQPTSLGEDNPYIDIIAEIQKAIEAYHQVG